MHASSIDFTLKCLKLLFCFFIHLSTVFLVSINRATAIKQNHMCLGVSKAISRPLIDNLDSEKKRVEEIFKLNCCQWRPLHITLVWIQGDGFKCMFKQLKLILT